MSLTHRHPLLSSCSTSWSCSRIPPPQPPSPSCRTSNESTSFLSFSLFVRRVGLRPQLFELWKILFAKLQCAAFAGSIATLLERAQLDAANLARNCLWQLGEFEPP